MANSAAADDLSAFLPSKPDSKPATYIDFLNPLLWMLFTNFAVSFGPSIMQASDADAETRDILLLIFVCNLISNSPSLSGRTVITTILLAAHVGLFGPMFFSDITPFTRFTFMVWSLSLGLVFGIWLAFALGKPEARNKMQRLLLG
ncbi:hypothetical protein V1506DRAFT_554582 [Lipomyces tetrasporus]